MRIAIVGAGGIGAPLGASLARAGQDVVFVARGAHLAAMRANGLRVEGDRGESAIRPVRASDDPAALGPVDLVLFCVKLWDVETTAAHIRPLIGRETAVPCKTASMPASGWHRSWARRAFWVEARW